MVRSKSGEKTIWDGCIKPFVNEWDDKRPTCPSTGALKSAGFQSSTVSASQVMTKFWHFCTWAGRSKGGLGLWPTFVDCLVFMGACWTVSFPISTPCDSLLSPANLELTMFCWLFFNGPQATSLHFLIDDTLGEVSGYLSIIG